MKKFVVFFLSLKFIYSFISQGFLCPICHRKFADTARLEHHYLQAHSESDSAASYPDTNGTKNSIKHEETDVKNNNKYKKQI